MQNNFHLSEEEISVYAEQISSGKTISLGQEKIEHIKECDECAQAVMAIVEIISDSSVYSFETKEKRPKVFPLKFVVGIAASFAAIVMMVSIWYTLSNSGMDANQDNLVANDVEQNDVIVNLPETKDVNPLVAENEIQEIPLSIEKQEYMTNKSLDQLVDRFSGSTFRGADIMIKTQSEITQSTDKPVELTWENKDRSSLLVEVVNVQGEVVKEINTSSDGVSINLKNSGAYYWKLMNEDFDLLFCGKIFVDK